MLKFKQILEENNSILDFLVKRRLLVQYMKVKQNILSGINKDLKLRQPKNRGIWYFRINRQFRAYGVTKGDCLVIFKIDNHQNK